MKGLVLTDSLLYILHIQAWAEEDIDIMMCLWHGHVHGVAWRYRSTRQNYDTVARPCRPWVGEVDDGVGNIPYIPMHGDDKISMTTYNPPSPYFVLKQLCGSYLSNHAFLS